MIFAIEGLTARIKPNRTSFVVESGLKPNVTCESDCRLYDWKCTYQWKVIKNKKKRNPTLTRTIRALIHLLKKTSPLCVWLRMNMIIKFTVAATATAKESIYL